MDKKKYEVKIADIDMKIISDEKEDVVLRLVSQLDSQITEITKQSRNCSKIDAAILVALDHASNRAKAEKRVRNLEAQIALYDANLRRMREENVKMKNAMLGNTPVSESVVEEQLTIDDSQAPAEEPKAAEDKGVSASMKKEELIQYAKDHGIEIDAKAKKADIIDAINSAK
jgi:cell division protein ZapA (FtsZ GTPase activity inhibitor)